MAETKKSSQKSGAKIENDPEKVGNPAKAADNPATGTIEDTDATRKAVEEAREEQEENTTAASDDDGPERGVDGENPVTPNNPPRKAIR